MLEGRECLFVNGKWMDRFGCDDLEKEDDEGEELVDEDTKRMEVRNNNEVVIRRLDEF